MVVQMMVYQLEMCKSQVQARGQGQAQMQKLARAQLVAQALALQEAQAEVQVKQEAEVQAKQEAEVQAQQEVQAEQEAQVQAAQEQEKQSSVQHQLSSHQQQLQRDLQGLAPSASHTWPNLAPIQVEPSSLAPRPQPREELEAELRPLSLRMPSEWSGQETEFQLQQHPQPQICSPSSAMVPPVGGCPYPPCQLYCPEGHSRSEQRLTSTGTSSAVAEGAAPDGFWKSHFHSP
jgi:hypothetical protein